MGSLWTARLQNKMVDVFRKIADVWDELEGAPQRGAVIDCEVLNVSFKLHKQEGQVGAPLYTVRLVVFGERNIEFHDISICYKERILNKSISLVLVSFIETESIQSSTYSSTFKKELLIKKNKLTFFC